MNRREFLCVTTIAGTGLILAGPRLATAARFEAHTQSPTAQWLRGSSRSGCARYGGLPSDIPLPDFPGR